MTNQLRIRVAEAMGWEYCPAPAGGVTTCDWRMPNGGYTPYGPHYDTDANAALLLVARLKEQGWRLHLYQCEAGGWVARFKRSSDGASAIGRGTTPEIAICGAFLKAI